MDVRKIGALISELRRNKDYTQGELANLLKVSHQAVSKWERGESLPDIGLLPELSSLLGITIDALLSGEAAGKERDGRPASLEVAADSEEHYPESQLELTADDAADNSEQRTISWEHIITLAPFLPSETLEMLVETLEGETDWSSLSALAPFLGRASLERLVGKVITGSVDARQILALAPFLGKEPLDQLVDHALDNLDWEVIQGLCPFVDRATLSKLVQQEALHNPDAGVIAGLAPFLDRSDLAILVKRIQSGQLDPKHLSALAPFLPQELLHELVLPFKAV
ncbi:helix-turn-helix transcriptional regulator [Paenibacillus solisilvae]|uniref:Helix-turn-helix transcriptional regulator n=1 Tax=Paenibacillus solisilvae TaxID=2486751 RepID=A0ABW0W5M1_9BACL